MTELINSTSLDQHDVILCPIFIYINILMNDQQYTSMDKVIILLGIRNISNNHGLEIK